MDKRLLEMVLSDQMEELDRKRKIRYCRRKEEESIDLDSPQAQVVIGVRRSGKSTLCYCALQRKGVKYAYVNFDDERLVNFRAEQLNDVLEVLYKLNGDFNYLFIDEIQNIPEWYLFVNRLLRRGMHVIITGSNANLLSGELATHLTGRHNAISLYPFSFAEYCEVNGVDTSSRSTLAVGKQRALFDQYLRKGGFPELLYIKNEKAYINGLVDNIIKRDIEQRFRIAYTTAFENLAGHILNNVPTVPSEKDLQTLLSIRSIHTVKNYLSHLKEAYLLSGLRKFSPKSSMRVVGEKLYPIDVALMNKRTDAFVGDNLGWRLETIVYVELLRKYKNRGYDIYYYRDRSGECDFLVCENRKTLMAIQVSYDLSNQKTRKREINGLLLASRKTGCKNLLLLTDYEAATVNEEEQTIEIRPVYEFLLDGEMGLK